MSSAKEMRFMQIYSENERKNKRVKELILGWQNILCLIVSTELRHDL